MDRATYAAVTDLCARLAGRVGDDLLETVRTHYACGEPYLAESALVLTLAYEGIGLTGAERALLVPTLDPDGLADLARVPHVERAPGPFYRFTPRGPADAPDPGSLSGVWAEVAPAHGGVVLYRAWREPLPGAPDAARWAYLLSVRADADPLAAQAGLCSTAHVRLRDTSPLEVLAEGVVVRPYQAALVAGAVEVWSARAGPWRGVSRFP
ncbi:hypothetical protein [Nocardiopsis lambiniae]|uniref:Uncharacterized protein n=1 Tax=Nocardiopsis lambiniae TaxID=3075539 RepID=A0ABU2MHC3_9ACTN|nr:hypothetical protein [Nocardiopsis sp. DSM 44743]MDT0332114.1 hypothetical protein [Nocardiopsis sp. DSM 44743]